MRCAIFIFQPREMLFIQGNPASKDGTPGPVAQAQLSLVRQILICIDSPTEHALTFTPAISFSVGRAPRLHLRTPRRGRKIRMPLGAYPFRAKFA
ncbi:MAG: hypothetical protein H0X24_19890 [Ktedonobacterales bacterium]|nr:hypothetical protein [Ktedonobacterales bacterium]